MQYWLVMPAAGSGQRFGGDVPKQYTRLAGRPLIAWSLRPFLEDPRCRGLRVALAADDPHWAAVAAELRDARIETCLGGAERCGSVLNALASLPAADEDWVLVHDAARPCVTAEEIDRLLLATAHHEVGGLLAVPLADTLKRSAGDGSVDATVPRDGLWRALTPQMFRVGLLRRALESARALGIVPTDESQAMELQDAAPLLVPGAPENIKVTTPADLAFAESVLASRGISP